MLLEITADDIEHGVTGDCYHCAAARALQRATGDDEANVHEHDWEIRLEANSLSIVAPADLAQLVRDFDDCGQATRPAAFTLPPVREWSQTCGACHRLAEPSELDDGGYCEECRK